MEILTLISVAREMEVQRIVKSGPDESSKHKTMRTYLLLLLFACFFGIANAQVRDTLKLQISVVSTTPVRDTIFSFSSRVDTIAMQPLTTDTSLMVRDVNKQDLEKSKYRMNFMGSVRINGFFDFSGMSSTEGFEPYNIPVGESKTPGLSSSYIGARQSRFGVEGNADTKVGKIRTYLEVDFASSTSSFWRLRHAFAEWNYLKLGYTWTTFMDNSSLPTTVEFEGPNSSLNKRHGVIRFEKKLRNEQILGISLESPTIDYDNPADTGISDKLQQMNLDLAGRYKYVRNWGHFQIAGIIRHMEILEQGEMVGNYGYGILLSSTVHFSEKHQINAQFSGGKGIAHYYVGFANKDLDAVYDPVSNQMVLVDVLGGFINYSYRYNPQIIVSVIGGLSTIQTFDFEPDNAFKSSTYFGINGFYRPIETIRLGMEVTSGERENKDSQTGRATRISLIAQFDF
jgi:hypothetical protein